MRSGCEHEDNNVLNINHAIKCVRPPARTPVRPQVRMYVAVGNGNHEQYMI